MSIDLKAIATDAVDALKTLKDEMDVLTTRIKGAEDKRQSVAGEVFLRVMSDYRDRMQALEVKAAPLRNEVRLQYAKLAALMNQLEEETGSIKLDREEVEFRHQLGEFDNAEFKKRCKALDEKVGERAGLITQAEALKARFLASVSAEHELLGDVAKAASSPAPSAPVAAVTAPAPISSEQTTQRSALPVIESVTGKAHQLQMDAETGQVPAVPSAAAAAKAPPPPPMAMDGNPGATMVMPSLKASPGMAPMMGDSTVVMRAARLVPQNPEAGKTTHVLGLKPMQIGTDTGAEIKLAGPGVEARHASITPQPQGYVLKDLGSAHGTRVNAVRITEQLLDHEDVVQIGAARFVFRLG